MARSKRNLTTNSPEDATVILRGVSVPMMSDVGQAFVSDCSRNRERLLNDAEICEKYGLTMDAWTSFAQNKMLRLKINAEHERRIRNGTAAQESAAKIFTSAPEVLGEILNDKSANARHRIEAARELRATAGTGSETIPTADRFQITIVLSADEKLVIDKPIAPMTPEEAKENRDVE
jgi:hypothetical protein